jgi:intracellular multiplication protein IcmO
LASAPDPAPALATAAEVEAAQHQGTALLASQAAADEAAPPEAGAGTLLATVAAPAAASGDEGVTFDGGQLEAVNVFHEIKKKEVSFDILTFASAASAMIETALELSPSDGERFVDTGLLDKGSTELVVSQIALGLGASVAEAAEASKAVIVAATEGTEYPVPPKPAKDGKDQEMEDVMSNLESLIGRR